MRVGHWLASPHAAQLVIWLLLAGFNLLSAFIQRSILRQVASAVKKGTAAVEQINDALHKLWPCLYACVVGVAVWTTWRGLMPALVLTVGVAAMRTALFDPVLHHGLPGRRWSSFGESADYDKLRRRVAARWGWNVDRMGRWSVRVAVGVTLGAIIGLWLLAR